MIENVLMIASWDRRLLWYALYLFSLLELLTTDVQKEKKNSIQLKYMYLLSANLYSDFLFFLVIKVGIKNRERHAVWTENNIQKIKKRQVS